MALINMNQKNLLSMLNDDMLKCIIADNFVNVHIQSGMFNFSSCVIPDNILVDHHNLMITQGMFEYNIEFDKVDMFDISYSNNENSYQIQCDSMQFYFDFNP